MDGPSFLAYVEQVLVPTLRKNDIIFMDNLRTHKIDGVAAAIVAAGAKVRYLPAYLLARSQSDRDGILEVEDGAAQGRGSHGHGAHEAHRQTPQDVCAQTLRELLSTCRIWVVTLIRWKTL
jgi:hypothetical protein